MNEFGNRLGLFCTNLVLLIGLGVLLSWWLLYYTSLFPQIGGLLGLGGVLAWAAFVTGLITEDRKAQMRDAFERRGLLSRKMATFVLLVLIASASLFGFFGSIEVGAIRDSVNRTVRIHELGDDDHLVREVFLPARGSTRVALPTAWFGSRRYRVKVSGLPSTVTQVEAWHRKSVTVPDTFLSQPVVFLWPGPSVANMVQQVRNEGGRARLTLHFQPADDAAPAAHEPVVFEPYAGQSIWIGLDRDYSDFEIPPDLVRRWQATQAAAPVREAWQRTLAGGGVNLEPGQRIQATLDYRSDPDAAGDPRRNIAQRTLTVRPARNLADLPQKEVLDVQ